MDVPQIISFVGYMLVAAVWLASGTRRLSASRLLALRSTTGISDWDALAADLKTITLTLQKWEVRGC